jgi:drug/metabolite transporter (DMT)-like permease
VGDFYILLCAVFFALQILLVDHFVVNVDIVELSLVQFFTVAVISSVFMLTAEKPEAASILAAIWPLLYLGIFSSGIAYTLQIVAQKGSNPALISILLSLESVFAVIGGALFLKDQLSGREYFGCLLMLVAVVLAQVPEKKVSE